MTSTTSCAGHARLGCALTPTTPATRTFSEGIDSATLGSEDFTLHGEKPSTVDEIAAGRAIADSTSRTRSEVARSRSAALVMDDTTAYTCHALAERGRSTRPRWDPRGASTTTSTAELTSLGAGDRHRSSRLRATPTPRRRDVSARASTRPRSGPRTRRCTDDLRRRRRIGAQIASRAPRSPGDGNPRSEVVRLTLGGGGMGTTACTRSLPWPTTPATRPTTA